MLTLMNKTEKITLIVHDATKVANKSQMTKIMDNFLTIFPDLSKVSAFYAD